MTSNSPAEEKKGLDLSVIQVAAGALATVSAATVAGWFGVKGTLIGAVVMSITATIGSAVYSHSMKRAGRALRGSQPTVQTRPGYHQPRVYRSKQRRTQRRRVGIVGALAATFALGIGLITVIELVTGESTAGFWGHGGNAPSIVGGGDAPAPPPPTTTRTTPTASVPSVSPSVTTSASATPTDLPSPSQLASPSASPTVTASVTPTPTASPTSQGQGYLQAPSETPVTTSEPTPSVTPTPTP